MRIAHSIRRRHSLLGRRGRTIALTAIVFAIASTLPGCMVMRIAGRNIPLTFRTPTRAPEHASPVFVPSAHLAVTWIWHATVLVQLDDKLVLADPVFTDFVGGFSHRLVAPGLSVDELPPLAAVVVSHRHFDHLSPDSLSAIGAKTPEVLVPEGASDDVPDGPYKTTELSWWSTWTDHGLSITAVPVQHEGGRLLDASAHPLSFTAYVIEYRGLTVYFGGDTAYAPHFFHWTAAFFPHVDLALLPIGPIEPRDHMRVTHMDPFEALEAARDLGAQAMIPIHFDTFVNSYDEPGDCGRALAIALARSDSPFPASRVFPLRIGEQRVLKRGEAPVE